MATNKDSNMNSIDKEIMTRSANNAFVYAVIHRQIVNCIVNDNYKAGIYTYNLSNLETASDMLRSMIIDFKEHLRDIRPIMISKSGTEIYFKNGSYIINRKLNEGQRGRRLNDIIYDTKIDKDAVNCVIGKMFIPYHSDDRIGLKMIGVEF